MTTTLGQSGALVDGYSGSNPVIVGSGLQLTDSDDGTYATSTGDSVSWFELIDTLPADVTVSSASDISLHLRASFANASVADNPSVWCLGVAICSGPQVYLEKVAFTYGGGYDGIVTLPDNVGTMHDLTIPLTDADLTYWGTTLADVVTTLRGTPYLMFDQMQSGMTVYEAWLEIGASAPTVAPPCRLYPREDDLGVGSGRIYPPPRSQQRSLRRVGGYY